MVKGDFKSMITAYYGMKGYYKAMVKITNKLKPYIEILIAAGIIEKEKSYNIGFDVIVKECDEICVSPQVIRLYKKGEEK